jgi:tetratricopeptide (TPR) repeat protein
LLFIVGEGHLKTIIFATIYLLLATIAYADTPIYAVQILMAREYENAVNDYERLKDYQDIRIEKRNDAYYVRIGSYQEKAKALALLKQIKMTHPDAFLIKYAVDKRQIVRGNQASDQQKGQKVPPPARNPLKNDSDIPTPPTRIPISTTVKKPETPNPPTGPEQSVNIPKQSTNITKHVVENSLNTPEQQKQPAMIEDDLLKAGLQSYQDGKHEVTISLLSKYASLAPQSEQRAAALLIVGKSFEQIKRPKSALNVYGQILDQYPDSPESLFSIVALADISVHQPDLHYPLGKKGAEYFKDPVSAYDTVLLKNVPLPMIEHIQYQKGLALWKLKRYEQSRETQTDFLNKFPKTAYRKEVMTMLKDSTGVLIDQYYQSKDHISVANIFLQGWKNRWITTEDTDTLLKSSSSLTHLGLHDDSLSILNTLRKSGIGKASADIDKAVAEIENKRERGMIDQLPSNEKWKKFQTGREYLTANNIAKAEQTFTDLNTSEKDQFWSKITEYALEEKRWTQKYGAPVKK